MVYLPLLLFVAWIVYLLTEGCDGDCHNCSVSCPLRRY